MKYLIFGTLALLLFLSQTALAQKWEEFSRDEIQDAGQLSKFDGLYQLAIGYVIQKGEFESTKGPLTGDSYKPAVNKTTYEQRNTSTLTYFRFNFTLNEVHGSSAVDASVIISLNPSNFNFVVENYHYNVDSDGNTGESVEEEEGLDNSLYSSAYLDARTVLTGDGELVNVVSQLFDAIIEYNIWMEDIPDADYEIQHVYSAYMEEYAGEEEIVNEEGEIIEEGDASEEVEIVEDDDVFEDRNDDYLDINIGASVDYEEVAGPAPGYRTYDFTVKAKSSQGKYYLVTMSLYYNKEKNGKFSVEEPRLWGEIRLGQEYQYNT